MALMATACLTRVVIEFGTNQHIQRRHFDAKVTSFYEKETPLLFLFCHCESQRAFIVINLSGKYSSKQAFHLP